MSACELVLLILVEALGENLLKHRRTDIRELFLPVEIGEPRRIPESLGERVGIDLEFGDKLVLVGGDRGEDRFREDEGPVLLLFQIGDWTRAMLSPFDQVNPWLIAMHGVQHDLKIN